jgi:hypothetical protein
MSDWRAPGEGRDGFSGSCDLRAGMPLGYPSMVFQGGFVEMRRVETGGILASVMNRISIDFLIHQKRKYNPMCSLESLPLIGDFDEPIPFWSPPSCPHPAVVRLNDHLTPDSFKDGHWTPSQSLLGT